MSNSAPKLLSVLVLITMLSVAIVMVYPYAYMVGSSLKTRGEFARDKRSLIPRAIRLASGCATPEANPAPSTGQAPIGPSCTITLTPSATAR